MNIEQMREHMRLQAAKTEAEKLRKAAKKKLAAKRAKRWEPQFPGSHRGF